MIAGEAMGITVHDVLSNGFWSAEQRSTLGSLRPETRGYYRERYKKEKTTILEDGSKHYSYLQTISCSKSPVASWRYKNWYNSNCTKDGEKTETITERLSSVRKKGPREKFVTNSQVYMQLMAGVYTNYLMNSSSTYITKPRQRDARPVESLVIDDWFPNRMTTESYKSCRFFGTEHNAVTNIISDNEAYITGTISQTGHIDEYHGEKMDESASLLRTYTQHITTDADHVYVEQEITEDTQNDPVYNSQTTWQTQYTATFKKGRWKGSTETISQVSNKQMADWRIKQKLSQNYR